MVKHIVLLRLLDRAEGKAKSENIAMLKRELETLPSRIREIHSFEVGVNFNPSEGAYDLSVVAVFADRQELETYLRHPEHLKVVAIMNRVRDTRVFVDYEFQGS